MRDRNMSLGGKDGPPVVFLGPTLPHVDASRILDAVYLHPASQGSVLRAVQRYDPSILLIVDGSFQLEPAVRHKEILWALERGVPVVGAASIGALRAAELYPHMHGVGLIYRWYRRFPFTPDDAVAVLHGPPEISTKAFTVALLDLRMSFRAAERSGVIPREFRTRLDAAAHGLNFRDRTISSIVNAAWEPADGDSPEHWCNMLTGALVEQKKLDAIRALELVRDGAFASPPRPVPFVRTMAFLRDLQLSGIRLD
jgi:hypothetical protein